MEECVYIRVRQAGPPILGIHETRDHEHPQTHIFANAYSFDVIISFRPFSEIYLDGDDGGDRSVDMTNVLG